MAASLGSTTYTSVSWTAGDVLTEAKLDNMVANDQAYDSHAAQGLLLNNDKSFAGKNAAGSTNMNLIKVDSSDQVQVGENNVGDHTVINAGTSKLVKVKVLRQNNTTNAYTENSVILTGWGYIQGNNTGGVSEAVTFGITFSEVPVVVSNMCGIRTTASGAPSTLADLNADTAGGYNAIAQALRTTGFTSHLFRTDSALASSYNFGYSWIAIGQLN